MISGCVVASSPVSNTSILAPGSPFRHSKSRLPSFKCSWKPANQELKFPLLSSRVVARKSLLSVAASTSFSSWDPNVPKRRRNITMTPKASKDSFGDPAMTKKPKWWWRSLACLPYLMPLQKTWMYAKTTYHLHPFLEDFELLNRGTIWSLPSWLLIAYFSVAYFGIVRKKECPHYFRSHVVIGMLLDMSVGSLSHYMPLAMSSGKVEMYFWAAVAFACYLFIVLECIGCAVAGRNAYINPFVYDAAKTI